MNLQVLMLVYNFQSVFPSFFRTNFPRLCVLRVCQQSEKHLDKILNVDEFVKRIFTVIHSNDPVLLKIILILNQSILILFYG
jgi:integrator complex subunit 7